MTTRGIRSCDIEEVETLLHLYDLAFPEEDLKLLVRALGDHKDVLSLVAEDGRRIVGHAAATLCALKGTAGGAALLGPVAIDPSFQRLGIGTALIEALIGSLTDRNIAVLFVLGDPAYYGRFGFEGPSPVAPPYTIPTEWAGAWQMRVLAGPAPMAGTLDVPSPWRDPALWGPTE